MRHIVVAAWLMLAASAHARQDFDPTLDPQRYAGCVNAVSVDAAKVEAYATEWQALGGGLPARHCLALAQTAQGRHAAAAQTLARAAELAERLQSPMVVDFWGQAGNAALLAGDSTGAIRYFNSAIAEAEEGDATVLAGLLIDRARARVDAGALAEARADLDRAQKLDEADAQIWLLSAALARRMADLDRAQQDIARAASLASEDADVLLEQGQIAAAMGDVEAARQYWQQAERANPDSEAARLAREALVAGPR